MSLEFDDPKFLDPNEPGLTPAQQLNRIGYKRALNRRNFIAALGATGVAAAGAGLLAGCGGKSAAAGPAESDVLNFALNLEYLEAEFYLFATTGTGLPTADKGTSPGTVTGGVKTVFTDPLVATVAAQITTDEMHHVEFLRNALGSKAVPEPNINLAALGSFATQTAFLTISRAFEDTGVSAYGGAVGFLTGDNLKNGARIGLTEAYHASQSRRFVIEEGGEYGGPAVPKPGALDSIDVPPDSTHYFPVDTNGLAPVRTTSQVLMIVYATTMTGVSMGGFFPNGLNGVIKTT